VTTALSQVLIALSIMLATLMLIGFLWIVNQGLEERIYFDRLPWWGPPMDRTSDSGGLRNIPASFPGLCRDSAPGRIDPVTQLRPWLISFAVFAVTLVAFAAFASALMNE
jgi:hypothetical protein